MQPVVITMGDPAGIGPKIISALIKARARKNMLIIGDARMLPDVKSINHIDDYKSGIAILDRPCPNLPKSGIGDTKNAAAIIEWIEEAVTLVKSGHMAAMITAPINKDILARGAAFPDPGHTEFLARLDGANHPIMLLASQELKVVPATIHIALSQVPKQLTPDLLNKTIDITYAEFIRLGVENPRIAIAGLNPHAGENGRMGDEELSWINDLVEKQKASGKLIKGPLPADTMFHKSARAQYDVAICMYHDQALIPIKTLAFDTGVNVTLGLSFLRTSPDHGTAYDIAGKGIASASSMIAAFDLAERGRL